MKLRAVMLRALSAPRLAALLVFVVATALYLPSLRNGFAYDDHVIIRLNETLHDLTRAHRIFGVSYWPDEDLGLYRPLTSLSYAVDWAIAGDRALWFHIMNVLWNSVACVLAFAVLLCFVPAGAALLGAMLFAVHPVHVEAVANVVGRAEVMAAVFCLAALLLWLRAPAGRMSARRITALAICYALALLSKESAIMLPALVALADIARRSLRTDNVRAWLARHWVALSVLAVVAMTLLAARTAVLGEIGPDRVDPALDLAVTAPDRIRTALQGWPHIMRLLVYPRVLLSDYGPRIIMPALMLTPLALLGGLIFGLLAGGGLIAWLRGRARLAFVLLFLPVALLPTSNLIVAIGVIVAERALYLPSFALAAAVAFMADVSWHERRARTVTTICVGVVALLFAGRTLVRIPEWRSTATIFAALRRDRPDSFRAQWHSARTAANEENVQLALQRYAETLNTWPYRETVVVEAANYAARGGDLPFAQRITDFALQRWPDNVDALRLRAGIALDFADTTAARALIARGLSVAPNDSVFLRMRSATASRNTP